MCGHACVLYVWLCMCVRMHACKCASLCVCIYTCMYINTSAFFPKINILAIQLDNMDTETESIYTEVSLIISGQDRCQSKITDTNLHSTKFTAPKHLKKRSQKITSQCYSDKLCKISLILPPEKLLYWLEMPLHQSILLMVPRNCACVFRIDWQYRTFRRSRFKVRNMRQI